MRCPEGFGEVAVDKVDDEDIFRRICGVRPRVEFSHGGTRRGGRGGGGAGGGGGGSGGANFAGGRRRSRLVFILIQKSF